MLFNIFFGVLVLLLLIYTSLILYYRSKFLQLKPFLADAAIAPQTRFSVVIPARNEEDNIETSVASILQQNYPVHLFEIVVIDDHSTDRTAAIVEALQTTYPNLRLMRLSKIFAGIQLNSYKKKAIEVAVKQAANEWIITTDADCIIPSGWLHNYDAYIQKHQPVFVAAPVSFINTGSFVSVFQCLDFISLQGITAAAVSAGVHSMCNGANLAYNKNVFLEVEGFKGVDDIASGDDMLLMHKIKHLYPNQMGYLFSPSAIVQTLPMPDWTKFINQRIRWASKADKYNDKGIIIVLALVYALNVMLLLSMGMSFFSYQYLLLCVFSIAAKTIIELSFMIPVATFFNHRKILGCFPLMQPVHIIYTVLAGWLGKFGKYQWKGRNVK